MAALWMNPTFEWYEDAMILSVFINIVFVLDQR